MLTFHIDKSLSDQEGCLVVIIQSETSLKQHSSEAVRFLLQEELKYQQKLKGRAFREASVSAQISHIPYSRTVTALKLLAATGQLYFNERNLVCDFFSKTSLYYRVESQQVEARLQTLDQDFALSSCDFLCGGQPHWYIKGIFLKMIQTEVSWNELKKAFQGKLSLTDIDNDPEDPLAPKIVRIGATTPPKQDPLPQLVLKDRSGAFADLWMDYGNGQCFAYNDATPHKLRQKEAEVAWEKDLLETDFIKKVVGTSHYFCPMDKVVKSLVFLLDIGWKILDSQSKRLTKHTDTQLSVDLQEHALLVKGKVRFDTFEADVTTVVGAFNRRERFLQLGNDTVALLPDSLESLGLQSLQEEWEIIGDSIKLPKSRFGLLDSSVKASHALADIQQRLQGFQGVALAPPSALFKGQLRPYQQGGVDWLQFLYDYGFHGLLADDMGLGKTVQVLAFLSRLDIAQPILVVLPTSLLFNWKKELEQFLPSIPVMMHHGPLRAKTTTQLIQPQIILTTYTTLRIDLPWLSTIQYQCVILDEAQAIKNSHTQTAQAVYSLQALFRLSITGTPLENRLSELWSQFRFLIPDLFQDEKTFEAELQAGASDSRFFKRIQKKIRPFLLRRKKEEVAKDLPERIEQVVWVEMEETQRNFYDDFLRGVRSGVLKRVLTDGLSKHRMEVLEAILRLRQICCDPLLVSAQFDENPIPASSKLDILLQDIDTVIAEERKALVYSQFTSMLGLLAKKLREKGISFAYLDGSTSNREKVVQQFQEDKRIPLFLISLKAGGIGLNLTAADYVFLYDPWWNEAIENQAIDRAHRIGRRETVIAKRYIMVESIEEKIMKLKAHKRSLVENLLSDDAIPTALTEEDFYFLLS